MNFGRQLSNLFLSKCRCPTTNQKRLFIRHYRTALTKHPYATQAVQTSVLLALGDIIAQSYVEKRKIADLDVKRCLKFTSLGLLMGPALHYWYFFLDKRFGTNGLKPVLLKVAVDQILMAPVVQAAVLSLVTFMNEYSIQGVKDKLEQDYLAVLITGYKVWPFVQLCNFYIVPLSYRVPFVQAVGVLWNTYLSYKANKPVVK